MTTVGRQGEIIQIHDNRITRLTENVSKTKYWKSVKKVLLNVTQKAQNSQILFTSQESAQECWKCKIVLQIRKSAQCLVPRCTITGFNTNNCHTNRLWSACGSSAFSSTRSSSFSAVPSLTPRP